MHVEVLEEPPAALGIQAPRESRDEGVEVDDLVSKALATGMLASTGAGQRVERANAMLMDFD